jgi:hypothetical protein
LKLIIPVSNSAPPKADPALLKAIARSRRWFDDPISDRAASLMEIAQSAGISRYVRRLMPLAFIAPADS